MVITMSRYKRSELEKAVQEKMDQGWVCIGGGIHEVGRETKIWGFEDGKVSKYRGRDVHKKYMVKMERLDVVKSPA
ncbi:hypothetical protein ACFVS2_20765 [Brevibacillus sp. NPDC058079]|uniref:hypothetical protein n=1 Tax=Brevibacillus sp. NPDC058079 TaxID=3346330 RepID=UPI0036EBC88A